VGHDTLGVNWGCVEEMKVGCRVWSRPTVETKKMGGQEMS